MSKRELDMFVSGLDGDGSGRLDGTEFVAFEREYGDRLVETAIAGITH